MRWSFRTGRWCCSRVYARASAPPCCSCPPPPAPKLRRSGRRQRFASLRFRPDGARASAHTRAHRQTSMRLRTKSHRHGRWLFQFGVATEASALIVIPREDFASCRIHKVDHRGRDGWKKASKNPSRDSYSNAFVNDYVAEIDLAAVPERGGDHDHKRMLRLRKSHFA